MKTRKFYLIAISPMAREREGHSCSLVRNNLGQDEIVVVGGFTVRLGKLKSVEIFNVATGTWRTG